MTAKYQYYIVSITAATQLAASLVTPAQPLPAKIHLHGGDSLQGQIIDIPNDRVINFTNNLFENPIQIHSEAFHSISLTPKPGHFESAPHKISLINGDVLAVELTALSRDAAQFDFNGFEELSIPRSEIHAITLQPRRSTLYSGPKPDDHWHRLKHWSYEGESLYCSQNAELALRIAAPERYEISLDYSWDRMPPNIIMIIGAAVADMQSATSDSYALQVSDNLLQVHRLYANGQTKVLDEVALAQKTQSARKLRAEINKTTNTIELQVDDSDKRSVIDPDAKDVSGKFLIIQSRVQNSTHPARIESLNIVTTTEQIPEASSSSDSVESITIEHGKVIQANIQSLSISEGKITYTDASTEGSQSLPLSSVHRLQLNHREDPSNSSEKFHFHLLDSSTVSSSKLELIDGSFKLTNPSLGEMFIPLHFVNSITHHALYEE